MVAMKEIQTREVANPNYQEVFLDTLDTGLCFTPATANVPEPLIVEPSRYVFAFLIKVWAMGTATYVGIGGRRRQDYWLRNVGDTFEWAGNDGQVMDMAKVWVVSDTNDADLQVIMSYVPLHVVAGTQKIVELH